MYRNRAGPTPVRKHEAPRSGVTQEHLVGGDRTRAYGRLPVAAFARNLALAHDEIGDAFRMSSLVAT